MTSPDIVVIPGGFGNRTLLDHEPLHEWIRGVHETSTWTTSVCTGSLILAAAGLLTGRRATSHWLAREHLCRFGVEATSQRVVFDGKHVTAAGVSAGIDMALALVGRIAGDAAAQASQLMLEYDAAPPYDAGSPATAPPQLRERLQRSFRPVVTS